MLLARKAVIDYSFDAAERPFLVFANGFDGCRGLDHLLRGIERGVDANVAPFEPTSCVFLHRMENLLLTVPESFCGLAHGIAFHDILPPAKLPWVSLRYAPWFGRERCGSLAFLWHILYRPQCGCFF